MYALLPIHGHFSNKSLLPATQSALTPSFLVFWIRHVADHNKKVQQLYEEMEQQIEKEKKSLQQEVGIQLN